MDRADGLYQQIIDADSDQSPAMTLLTLNALFGKAAVAYLPNDKIIGLSKMARIVDLYARRLQVQERLTNQVAQAMQDVLSPHGVAVVMDGRHLCMMMRGVQKQESSTVTSAMLGTSVGNPGYG